MNKSIFIAFVTGSFLILDFCACRTTDKQNAGINYTNKSSHDSFEHFMQLADQGNDTAQFYLGEMYDNGRGISQDHSKAVLWYKKAADQGNANAELYLGALYDAGLGVEQDHVVAAQLYGKAADQGNPYAQFYLGTLYEAGSGVTKDYAAAAQWYRKAADQDNRAAQWNLGVLFEEGRPGVAQDFVQADFWYKVTAKLGNAGAKKACTRIEKMMTRAKVHEAQALVRKWFEAHKKLLHKAASL